MLKFILSFGGNILIIISWCLLGKELGHSDFYIFLGAMSAAGIGLIGGRWWREKDS